MNLMESVGDEASLLGEDFAARVLQKADHLRARRRWQILTAAGTASAIVISAFFAWQGFSYQRARTSILAQADAPVSIGDWTQSFDGASQPSAMNVFFPDAMPLARFDARYTVNNSGVDIAGWVAPITNRWTQ